jgi:hypothetical protein
MKIERKSPFTGIVTVMDINVTEEQMREFASPNRRNIQDIFPNLSNDEREFIMTGITPGEWDEMFNDNDDDDDVIDSDDDYDDSWDKINMDPAERIMTEFNE